MWMYGKMWMYDARKSINAARKCINLARKRINDAR